MANIYLVAPDRSFAGVLQVPDDSAAYYVARGNTTAAPGADTTLNPGEFWQFDGASWQPAQYPATVTELVTVTAADGTVTETSQTTNAATRHVTDDDQGLVVRDVSVVTRELLIARLAAMRYAYETGGTKLADGTPIKTGREDVTLLLAAYTRLQGKPEGTATDWKAPTGWLTVTLEQLEPIWHTCSDFIAGAFSAERKVAEQVDQLTEEGLPLFDLRAAFAGATAAPVKTYDSPGASEGASATILNSTV